MSKLKQLAGETAIYGMGSILPKILNFVLVTPYLTRVLNNGDYGIHGLIYAYTALIMAVVTLRLETSFFRYATIGENKERAFSTAASVVSISVLLFVCLVFINAELIASYITSPEDKRFIQWFAFIIGFDALSALPFAKLRLENKAVRFSGIKIVNVLVTIIIIVFLLEVCSRIHATNPNSFLGSLYKEELLLDYVFIANLVASGIVFLLLLREYFSVEWHWDKSLIKKMIGYSWPLILVGVAAAINQVFDRVFIAELMPGTEDEKQMSSGIYNGASKIAVMMSLFATAFNYAAEPFFFKQYSKENSNSTYASVAEAYLLASSIVFLGITLFIDLFQYLIGENFRSGIYIVPVLLIAYLFLGLYYNFSIWYKLKDKTIYGAVIAFVGALVTISLSIWLIPKIGMLGASFAVMVCFICMCFLAIVTGRSHIKIPYPFARMLGVFLLALGIYFTSMWCTVAWGIGSRLLCNGILFMAYAIFAWWYFRRYLRMV